MIWKDQASDFMEMASVGSDDNINIVVQFDRIKGETSSFGNWASCEGWPYNTLLADLKAFPLMSPAEK